MTQEDKQLSAMKQAYLKLEELQARLDAVEQARQEPLAIIGMACRFPGDADDPEAFWRLLARAETRSRKFPPSAGTSTPISIRTETSRGRCTRAAAAFLRRRGRVRSAVLRHLAARSGEDGPAAAAAAGSLLGGAGECRRRARST